MQKRPPDWWSGPRAVNVLRYWKTEREGGMKALLIAGKALTLSFWLVFGAALVKWVGPPFEQLIHLLAAFLLVLHGVQLWLFADTLTGRSNPWLDRLQVLLFGIFHLYPLKPTVAAAAEASAAAEEAAHA